MRTEHKSFAEWRDEAMFEAVIGGQNTARWYAPLVTIDPLRHSPEEIDREIYYDFSRGKPYNGGILRLNSAGVR
ncbi:MAG: hypothetical protein PHF74_05630 [Dehalococcoidales bacterium]|nr:hypothetical protein [Dehalococcoidales bacterium]